VQVVRVDLESRKIDLRLAGADAPPPRAEKSDAPSKDRKTNIKPGPAVPKAQPTKAAPKATAKPAAKPQAVRKTKAAPAAAPRAAKPVSKSKKKR
jgi:ribonuclease R